MSVEQHQQTLANCYNGSDDTAVKGLAQQANNYTELLKNGQITNAEYVELMKDIERQISINNSISNQQVMYNLHAAVVGLITLASFV
jgi:hypothetical protein